MNEALPRIRPMVAGDIDSVCALTRTVWQITYPPLISQIQIDAMLADRYSTARIHSQLADPRHAWWVAEQQQTLVGFAHAMREDAGSKLDKLYIHPDRQRQGIGSALLRTVRDWARQQQASYLRLQVNRGNAQAIAAYLKYGFHITESRVFDIGSGFVMDDHVMELTP